MEWHSHGRPLCVATPVLLVQRQVWPSEGFIGRGGRQRDDPSARDFEKVHSTGQAVADQRNLVFPLRRERGQQHLGQHHPCAGETVRTVPQRGGVFEESAIGALRGCKGSVRELCHTLGQSEDGGALDDEQPMAILLRTPVRRVLQARRRIFWSQESLAPGQPGMGLLRNGRSQQRQDICGKSHSRSAKAADSFSCLLQSRWLPKLLSAGERLEYCSEYFRHRDDSTASPWT